MKNNEARNAKTAIEYFKIIDETGSRSKANAAILMDGEKVPPYAIPFFEARYSYTLAPKTHVVNGHTVPAPLREPPDHGAEYYITNKGGAYVQAWHGDHIDRRRLEQNRVFVRAEDAILNDEAAYQYGRFAK